MPPPSSAGALDVFARARKSGAIAQRPRRFGCLAPRALVDCSPGRALTGVSSIAVSADSRFVYAAAADSDAVDRLPDGIPRKEPHGSVR